MRQALSLVANTLYAAFLPTKGLDTLQVRVLVKSLGSKNQYTLARAGGNFYSIGLKRGCLALGRFASRSTKTSSMIPMRRIIQDT